VHDYLIEMLECPACHGELAWTLAERRGNRIETAEAYCPACAATYPIREGIGLFLTPDLPRDDLWEQMDSQLTQHLREHPEIERQLMDAPLETLTPADQFFRALVLDERGEYAQAKAASDLAMSGLYTPEYLSCSDNQVNFVIERLAASDGPIVDLASGRGHLVEEMARRLSRPIVATDFSPSVLRRDRRRFEFFGLYDQISLLAFDARRTPFRDGTVETLTTYQGLPNIREPGELLRELRRIVSGMFLAISHFYPEDDEVNAEVMREAKLETLLFRPTALECFAAAGWQVEVANARPAKASPTPPSVLLEGAGIDGLPVTETTLEFCVLLANSGD
jgi:uncharacterized protein YbaR (Trm112 family)